MSSQDTPDISFYQSVSNIMSEPNPLEAPIPTAAGGANVQLPSSSSNFFPRAASTPNTFATQPPPLVPQTAGETQILSLLNSLVAGQNQQAIILQDNQNDILYIQNFLKNQTNVPAAAPIAPTVPPVGPTVAASTSVPYSDGGNIKVRQPRLFDGRASEVDAFQNEMDNCIFLQRKSLKDDRDKCYYFGRYLKDGSPVDWFTNLKRTNSPLLGDFAAFQADFKSHFGTSDETGLFLRKLDALEQTGAVNTYISKFHDIISHLDLSEQTKIAKFKKGLKDELKKALIGVKVPATLALFEPVVTQIDNDLYEYNLDKKKKNKSPSTYTTNTPSTTAPRSLIPGTELVPMEVDAIVQGRMKLTPQERKRRLDGKLCMYAGCDIKDPAILAKHKDGCPVKAANQSHSLASGKGKST